MSRKTSYRNILNITMLFLVMSVYLLKVPFVYLDFYVRQDYIAKILCENKDEPVLECNGKCYLKKKLKAVNKGEEEKPKDETNTTVKLKVEEFCEEIFELHPLKYSIFYTSFFEKPSLYNFEGLTEIFHPPLQS